VTGYVVLTAYMVEPDGPWDGQAVTNSSVAAGVGLAFSGVMAALGAVLRGRRLSRPVSRGPLDLELPVGRVRYPAKASMRHLVRPLAPRVSYGAGVLRGLLAGG
jgi:hypothetical protein